MTFPKKLVLASSGDNNVRIDFLESSERNSACQTAVVRGVGVSAAVRISIGILHVGVVTYAWTTSTQYARILRVLMSSATAGTVRVATRAASSFTLHLLCGQWSQATDACNCAIDIELPCPTATRAVRVAASHASSVGTR